MVKMIKIKILIGFILVMGIFFGFQYVKDRPRTNSASNPNLALNLSSGTALPSPKILPEFKLVDHNQKLFSHKQLFDHWTFMFFGYTQCPGICPATLGKLNEMATLLGSGSVTEFVFVSIDPQNDTSKQLKAYFLQKQFKNADFLGVTGNLSDIQALAKTLGLFVSQNNITINGHIDHSGTVLLINPDGQLAAVFTNPNNPQAMARDFKALVHEYHQRQA